MSQYGQPYAPYQAPRQGMPVWGWIIIGCFGGGIVLVMILAAILFPVFAQARENARRAACASDLKQAGLAILMYAQDYDQRYPTASTWMDSCYPYVRNESIFHCPSLLRSDPGAYGYAYNIAMSRVSQEKVASPATSVLDYDSTDLARNANDRVSSLPPEGRHLKTNNVGFADGHVKWMAP